MVSVRSVHANTSTNTVLYYRREVILMWKSHFIAENKVKYYFYPHSEAIKVSPFSKSHAGIDEFDFL